MKSAFRLTLLLAIGFAFAGLLVQLALAGLWKLEAAPPRAAPGRLEATPALRLPLVRKPLLLEVQIAADHWQGDIHIAERWETGLLLEAKKSLHFRFKQPGDGPATVSYQVYRGSPLAVRGRLPRPLVSGSLGAPPGKGKTREFDIDFTKFLPANPDGKDYHVRLAGPAAGGGGSSVWSNTVKISYKQQAITQFPSPTLKRVIGTMNALGQELTLSGEPLAVITEIFRVEGTDLYEVPAETVVQFLKDGKVVKEVGPVPELTHKLPSGETSLAVRAPTELSGGPCYVRVKSPWGTTGQRRIRVGGNRSPNVGTWKPLVGGVYENHAWTEECQGIATDGKYWYISSNNDGERALYKFTIGMQLVARADLERFGSGHIGALDCFNNKLYVALEGPKRLLVMSTDFTNGKLYRLHGKKINDPDPLGGGFAWCAVHPITGDVYTAGDASHVVQGVHYYKKADDSNYVYGGYKSLGKAINRVQGGDITPAGKLVLASDSKPWGIYVYSVFTGEFYGAVTFDINPDHPDYEELEGLTVSPPGTAVVKGSPVNVHLVLLDNDWPDEDDVYFKHVAVPTLGDLFGF